MGKGKVIAVRAYELGGVFRSEKLARRIVKAGWLPPLFSQHRLVIYDEVDIHRWNAGF